MAKNLSAITRTPGNPMAYQAVILDISKAEEREAFEALKDSGVECIDLITKQLNELVKVKFPSVTLGDAEFEAAKQDIQGGKTLEDFGNHVYYPWLNKIVHIVGEDDFISIRTNRNMYKITPAEIQTLRKKTIGVIGLSVGQAIAQTIATERICGALRLADFDEIELSNLNRLSVGVHELGLPKVVVAARRVAELDPYIKVTLFEKGVNETNLDEFLLGDGKLDILVEECDSIDVKILSRIIAKKHKIPVVMETNDSGMLDIERFDLEPRRAIFHERMPELEAMEEKDLVKSLKNLTIQEKIGYLSKIIGLENVSDEMKVSLPEMGKSISGWPQIASSVMLGGAMVCDICRRILLNKHNISGRYFVDLKRLIG